MGRKRENYGTECQGKAAKEGGGRKRMSPNLTAGRPPRKTKRSRFQRSLLAAGLSLERTGDLWSYVRQMPGLFALPWGLDFGGIRTQPRKPRGLTHLGRLTPLSPHNTLCPSYYSIISPPLLLDAVFPFQPLIFCPPWILSDSGNFGSFSIHPTEQPILFFKLATIEKTKTIVL